MNRHQATYSRKVQQTPSEQVATDALVAIRTGTRDLARSRAVLGDITNTFVSKRPKTRESNAKPPGNLQLSVFEDRKQAVYRKTPHPKNASKMSPAVKSLLWPSSDQDIPKKPYGSPPPPPLESQQSSPTSRSIKVGAPRPRRPLVRSEAAPYKSLNFEVCPRDLKFVWFRKNSRPLVKTNEEDHFADL